MATAWKRACSKKYTIAQRRAQAVKLFIDCWTQAEIAEELGCSLQTVYNDLEAMRKQWREEQSKFTVEDEVLRTFDVERKAREGWERSCEDAETRSKKVEKGRANGKKQKKEASVVSLFSPEGDEQEVQVNDVGDPCGVAGELDKRLGDGVRGEAAEPLVPIKETVERTRKGQAGNPAFLDRVAWAIETRLKMLGALKGDGVNVQLNMIAPEQMMQFSRAFLQAASEVVTDVNTLALLQERTLQLMPGGSNAVPAESSATMEVEAEPSQPAEEAPPKEDEV